MDLSHVTFQGPEQRDEQLLQRVPQDLATLLQQVNGFVQMGGALHVRGACESPRWHSLTTVWDGELALHRLYAIVDADDVPFGENCVGDQFLLRDGAVFRLYAETGQIEALKVDLFAFLEGAQQDPLRHLSVQALARFIKDGGTLKPGSLLHAHPPFCVESKTDVLLRPASARSVIAAHARFASQIADLPDGTPVRLVVED